MNHDIREVYSWAANKFIEPSFLKYYLPRLNILNKILLFKNFLDQFYTTVAWSKCAKTHVKKIQVTQNKHLKILLNYVKDSHVCRHNSRSIWEIQQFKPRKRNNFWIINSWLNWIIYFFKLLILYFYLKIQEIIIY